jgi:glycosyltransferase involved in cell wall biosynthesis
VRILVLTPTFLPIVGGAELLIYEVYRRLASSHEVCVLTPQLELDRQVKWAADDYLESLNFSVKRFDDRLSLLNLRGHRMLRGLIPPFSLSAISALATSVRELKPEVIHSLYAVPTGLAAVVVERMNDVPVVLTFVGRDVPGPTTPPLWRFYDRFIAKLATDVTYISNYCRIAIHGAPHTGKGRTIYGGVDVHKFNPQVQGQSVRRDLGLDNDSLVLFALQRLSPEKRADVILRSMTHVLRGHHNVSLVIGGKGSEEPYLRDLSRELGIEDHVIFTGYIPNEELPQYFATADIFVFHSTYETFGLVLAQAMAAAKPIVSVRTTAVPEIVDDGNNGILVEPLNAEALAQAVLTLAEDGELRQRMGHNGRERAVQIFDWDHIAAQYETVLMESAYSQSRE